MIVFGHDFEPADNNQDGVCRNCHQRLRNSDARCPFRPELKLELEEETLP